jgi:cobalt-zinc-cadmium efflux system membrane fusion protein
MSYKIYSLILLSLTIILTGCGSNNKEQHDEHNEAEHSDNITVSRESLKEIGLLTETVKQKSFSGFISVPARVMINQDNEAQVGSLIQGRVYKANVKAGDYVKPGQILMYVEGLEVGEIKADFLRSKANLDFHKANYERQKALLDQKVGSQKSFLEAQTEYEKAYAEYLAEDRKIHSIGLKDEDILITKNVSSDDHSSGTIPVKAPIGGIIAERNVVIGQLVDATTNAFKIVNTSSLWVDGQVYEKDLGKISPVTTAYFSTDTYPDERFEAKLTYIGNIIDETTRTITVRADVTNNSGKLKPQMFGELIIATKDHLKGILIPVEAIAKIDNNDFVFVQVSDSVFQKRAITTGISQDNLIEIVKGLNENERVVIKGTFYLKSELQKYKIEEHEH